WLRYAGYWPLFAILFLLSIAGGWVYLHYTVPMYQSSAKILIKDEKKGAEDSKAVEEFNSLSSKKIIENEIEVIQSATLISEVVKTLNLYAPVFEDGKIRPLPAYLTSPIKIEAKDPNSLKKSGKIYFSYDSKNQGVNINRTRYPMNVWVSTQYGYLRFIRNNRFTGSSSRKFYFTLNNPKNTMAAIQQNLRVVSASKLSTILNLILLDEVPERGEDILNNLLAAYSKAILDDKNTLASNTLAFVEDRLDNVTKELAAIEQKAQKYRSNKNAIDISTQGRLFLENVSQNDQRLSQINMQLSVLKQVDDYANSKGNLSGIVPSTFGINDESLTSLLNKLSEAETKYETLKKTTAENNPTMLALSEQIGKLKPMVTENLRSQKASLEASKAGLSSTNNQYSSVLQSIPQKERELININREQAIKNEIYTYLSKKREETALSYASTVSDSRVVDKAQSSILPVSPKKRVVYMAAATFALLLGVGSITAKEKFVATILFRSEIEELCSYPILGEISQEKSNDAIVTGTGKKTFIAEQFRQLRIALNFFKGSTRKKKILITSTISGEGKSFVATNLALSFAMTGKKVILLELDLNRPQLSINLNVTNDKGISDFLLGDKDPEEIIKRTDVNENLFIISSGLLPENPSELLMNGKIEELLDFLGGHFYYILVDIARVGPVTDAYVLSHLCDVTLYVVRHKYTPKVFIERLDDNNKIKKLKNIALVFNGILPRGFGKNNYGYGYGYGHEYNQNGYYAQTPEVAKK
ncbi:MAG TPA: polysaccharide biosynthesis tyrosine autokinase, partial [Chitinophagaceae bacterium]|nr:polysaccharide biosynthesis tyrosine autokinase [Chitinophagaceae bacterium]